MKIAIFIILKIIFIPSLILAASIMAILFAKWFNLHNGLILMAETISWCTFFTLVGIWVNDLINSLVQ